MRLATQFAACVLLGSCVSSIDFREGIACRTDTDCDGYTCIDGSCAAPAPSDGNEARHDDATPLDIIPIEVGTGPVRLLGYRVLDYGNRDAVINHGETIGLGFVVKNVSSGSVDRVSIRGSGNRRTLRMNGWATKRHNASNARIRQRRSNKSVILRRRC